MRRDPQTQTASGLDLLLRILHGGRRRRIRSGTDWKTSPRIPQRDQTVVRVLHPVLMESLDTRQVPELPWRYASIRPVRPVGPQPRFCQRTDILLGVFMRADIVAIVADRRDSRVDGFGGGQPR